MLDEDRGAGETGTKDTNQSFGSSQDGKETSGARVNEVSGPQLTAQNSLPRSDASPDVSGVSHGTAPVKANSSYGAANPSEAQEAGLVGEESRGERSNTMGIIEEEDSMDFSSSVRSQIPSSIHREALSSYHHSQRTSKAPSQ